MVEPNLKRIKDEEERPRIVNVEKVLCNKLIKNLESLIELNLSDPIISEKELDGLSYVSIIYDAFVDAKIISSPIGYLISKNIPRGILNIRYLGDSCRTFGGKGKFKNPDKKVLINISKEKLEVTINFYLLKKHYNLKE